MILGPKYIKVVELLDLGQPKQAIAAELGVSGAAVSYYLRKLRQQTENVLLSV